MIYVYSKRLQKTLSNLFYVLRFMSLKFPLNWYGNDMYESKYSKMDLVKFFKACRLQILLVSFLNASTHTYKYLKLLYFISGDISL